eukprot:6491353-Amphidinium_carterae.1
MEKARAKARAKMVNKRRDINHNNVKAIVQCVASGAMQHQHVGTTTTPECLDRMSSSHIKLGHHQVLQQLVIHKSSAYHQQT